MRWKKTRGEFEVIQKFNGETHVEGQMSDEEAVEFFRDMDDCPLCQDMKAEAERRIQERREH